MSSLYTQNLNYSPARVASPQIRNNPDVDSQYLGELLAERQKLEPFLQVVPICSRLLNQEILRVSGMLSNHGFSDYDRLQRGSPSPMASSDMMPNHGPAGLGGWSGHPHEILRLDELKTASLSFYNPVLRFSLSKVALYFIDKNHRDHYATEIWCTRENNGLASSPRKPEYLYREEGIALGDTSRQLSKCELCAINLFILCFDEFNFVGRLLGPRGNSLKRVEASTGCRVFIRGKGSIKDPDKEETLRGRPGYEHLNDPLHILVEAELPVGIIDARLRQAREIIEELLKPVDESQDFYKRQQLRELAMLNSNFREESPRPSGSSLSPFNSSGMKRAKTGCKSQRSTGLRDMARSSNAEALFGNITMWKGQEDLLPRP
ncbi:hypothetical protein C3L33_07195, partial [Rhododendron williamsianum]